jgi:rhodanese-related sulfurtransferase
MKPFTLPSALAVLPAALVLAAPLPAAAQLMAGRPVQLVERVGASEQRVAEIRLELSAAGDWVTVTNAYTELADGLNHWDEAQGGWAESRAELELADGGAAGRHAHQRAWFAPNANDPAGAARLWTADGRRFHTSVLALNYRDAATGQEVLLATLKDTEGELLPPNQVIHRDAFEGLHADVVYTFRRTGVEQDVILRESPPDPEDFGLLAETTRLQALTEVFEAPEPVKDSRLIATVEDAALRARMAEPDWVDERLAFGSFRLAQGRAFSLGERVPGEAEDIPVAKTWSEEPDGRVLLVEAVDYVALTPALGQLPVPAGAVRRERAAWTPERRRERLMAALEGREVKAVGVGRKVPARRLVAANTPRQLSRARMVALAGGRERPGVVLDWRSESGALTNHVFRGDETYLLSGGVTCTGTNTVFEAGSVLKYESNATLTVQTPLDWQGSLYRPVVLTARDDWTVGQGITASNALSGLYAAKALVLDAGTDRTFTVKHLRVAHAQRALEIIGRSGHVLSHVQVVNCADGVRSDGADFSLRNALLHNVTTNLLQGAAATARLEHVTVNTAAKFNHNVGTVYVTNSILAGVTTPGTYTANAVSVHASAAGVFQAVGAGWNYLAAGSTNRNTGVTAVNPALRQELRGLTTYPPVILAASFTMDTTLFPQAVRDTDVPDRGYHYPPLDYYWSALSLTNAALRLTNGAVVGLYGTTGLTLRRGAKLHSDGAATALNRFVRYHTVQEQSNWGGGPASATFTMFSVSASSPYPEVRCTFTDFAVMANSSSGSHTLISGAPQVTSLSHCQVRGPALSYYGPDSHDPVFAFTNNLFESARISFYQANLPAYYRFFVHAYNNLFRHGYVTLESYRTDGPWTFKDNLFDVRALTLTALSGVTASHNGFRSGLSSFGSNNKTGLTLDYVAGPLGPYCYPLTGGNLSQLLDAGSRTAASAGLYHFTTRRDQVKEAATTVDIGHHYAATAPSGAGLVGYWSLNDGTGTQAADASTNAFHGTLVNGPAWSTGAQFGALAFDGANDQVSVPDAPALRLTTGMSIAFWLRKDSDPANQWIRLVGKGVTSRNYGVWDDFVSGRILFQFLNTGSQWQHLYSTNAIPTGVWQHVVCTWDGTTGRIYLNGVLDGVGAMSGTPSTSADPLTFGYAGYEYPFPGALDEVVIYNRALGAAEVTALTTSVPAYDADGDGLPDHHEDRNGDGSATGDPTSWLAYDSPNGLAGPLSLNVFTPLK